MFNNKISRFSKYSAAAGTLALCGCTMIPDYENPDETYGRGKLDAPEFKHAAGLWKNAAPSDGAPKGEWWAIFGDAKLDALIKACDANNPDIAAAEREVFAANAKIGSDTAAFFPTVSITGDVGFGANKIEDLLGASSLAWGVSPQVYIPIFRRAKSTRKSRPTWRRIAGLLSGTNRKFFRQSARWKHRSRTFRTWRANTPNASGQPTTQSRCKISPSANTSSAIRTTSR